MGPPHTRWWPQCSDSRPVQHAACHSHRAEATVSTRGSGCALEAPCKKCRISDKLCASQSFVARGTLDETRLGRADGRGALVRRRGCCVETAASTMHCNSQQPSVKTLTLALVLRVTTRAAGSGCLHCHGRGPAPLSCTSQPETCPLCDYSSPSDWERTAVALRAQVLPTCSRGTYERLRRSVGCILEAVGAKQTCLQLISQRTSPPPT